ncbi:MAG TPA: C13 family peptidase [Rhizomicrobium sp.]|nr:C13 family peptidase [Rhizomicrobium sp.]
MKKKLIALAVVLGVALGGAALMVLDGAGLVASKEPEPQAQQESHLVDFSHWAAILVAGDYRAQNGAPSKVFDNGRRELAKAFARIGFAPANMVQFSADYDQGTERAGVMEIAGALQTMAAREKEGCLIYFTSHGTEDGIIVGEAVLSPRGMAQMVQSACGSRPSVVVMSACYSGQFVAPLQAPNRIIMTASRPDRTSFGCGELDAFTFFDDCFLRALPMAGDFPGLGELVQQCVAEREVELKATPPSEPQVNVGPGVVFTLRWRDELPEPRQ